MDVDLDFPDRNKILEIIRHIPAAIKNSDGGYKKHNTGVYCQEIPVNPLLGTASFDYKEAENRGYFKLDFLNVNVYQGIENEQHLKSLLEREPFWELLLEDIFTDQLFHVNGHGNILRIMKPNSIEQLAAVLAMIRPSKKYLIGKSWDKVMNEIWVKPKDGEYYWKKSHAIAYASLVVVQMNLICEKISYEYS